MDFKCKSCMKTFKAINKHLTQKKECQSKYTEEEMQAISKMLTSARHQRYEKTKRKERAQKIRTYKLKKGVDQASQLANGHIMLNAPVLVRSIPTEKSSKDKPEV